MQLRSLINTITNLVISAMLIASMMVGGYFVYDDFQIRNSNQTVLDNAEQYKPQIATDEFDKDNETASGNPKDTSGTSNVTNHPGESSNTGYSAASESKHALSNNLTGADKTTASDTSNKAENGEQSGNSAIYNEGIAEMQKKNKEIIGWLTLDGTRIDYPFAQGTSNAQYVSKNIYKEFAISGSIFLDASNKPNFSDYLTIFYGHHMSNGTMFTDLLKYKEQDFLNDNHSGYISILKRNMKIDIFAALSVTSADEYIYSTQYSTDERKSEFLNYLKTNADSYRDIGANISQTFVVFTTCSSGTTNQRCAVVAVIS